MNTRLLAAPLALALALTSPLAHAVRAPENGISSGGLEAAPGLSPLRREVAVSYTEIPRSKRAAWSTFLADVGSTRWEALWDTSIGAPLRVFGEGVAAPGTMKSPEAAAKHALAFIERHRDLFAPGVAMTSLSPAANQVDTNGVRTVSFLQRAPTGEGGASVPVVGGQLSLRYKNDRLIVIASEVIPSARATPALIDAKKAAALAASWIGEQFNKAVIEGAPELSALPLVRERGVEVVTAWRVRVIAGSIGLPYDVYISASTGARVARDGLARFYQGTALFNVGERYPQGTRKAFPARLAAINVDGAPQATDAAGVFSWNAAPQASLDLFVHGAETTVKNMAGAEATIQIPVTDGGSPEWSLAADQYGDAQLTTFIHASIVKNRALLIAPAMPFLLKTLNARVNKSDPSIQCNAFWDGLGVNFSVEAGACNNTGRLGDVIYHEFGHGVHQSASVLGAGKLDPSFGEGQADYMACSTTGDSNMAPGFFTNGPGPLRICENQRRWPMDINAMDPHETGLIFTGAMWDLRAALLQDLGPQEGAVKADALYYAAIQGTSTVPTSYAEVIAADDDDGNLANGTPNICAINAAFVAHGLSPYASPSGLVFHHDPLTLVPFTPDPLEVRLTQETLFPQCDSSAISKVQLLWGPAGSSNKVTMTLDGSDYVGQIPPQADGASLRYRVITTVGGIARTLPDNLADPEYQVFVGDVKPIYCTDFEATADDWTFTTAAGGASDFEWGAPQGRAEDPSKAFSGSNVIGDDLSLNGMYSVNKTNYAESPVIDVTGHEHIRLQFRRWLAVQDGYYDLATIDVNEKEIWENDGTGESYGLLHHIDREWRFVDHDLSWVPAAGKSTVQVRFGLAADGAHEFGGWNIDDFCVVAWSPTVAGAGGAGGAGAGGEGGGGAVVDDDGCACEAAGASGGGVGGGELAAAGLVVIAAARRYRRRTTRMLISAVRTKRYAG